MTHVYTCICMYVCIYIYIYVYMYTHVCISLSLYIYIYTYTYSFSSRAIISSVLSQATVRCFSAWLISLAPLQTTGTKETSNLGAKSCEIKTEEASVLCAQFTKTCFLTEGDQAQNW